jgi:phenylalanine-4-hydroxylase
VQVSTWAYVAVAEAVPSVAGGPADPARWDEYFGALDSFTAGSSESLARQRKADELPRDLATLYAEVQRMRREKRADRKRLESIREEGRRFGDEPLLTEEIDELLQAN